MFSFFPFLSLHPQERNSSPDTAAGVSWDPVPSLRTRQAHAMSPFLQYQPLLTKKGPHTQLHSLSSLAFVPDSSSLVPLSPAGAGLGSSPPSTTHWCDVCQEGSVALGRQWWREPTGPSVMQQERPGACPLLRQRMRYLPSVRGLSPDPPV